MTLRIGSARAGRVDCVGWVFWVSGFGKTGLVNVFARREVLTHRLLGQGWVGDGNEERLFLPREKEMEEGGALDLWRRGRL